jgi:hypothetical protein
MHYKTALLLPRPKRRKYGVLILKQSRGGFVFWIDYEEIKSDINLEDLFSL